MAENVVDLSSNNGYVPILTLKHNGAKTVIVKATEGTSYVNPLFRRTANNTLGSDVNLVIYHFASGFNWQSEMAHFWDTVKDFKGKALFCLDYEGRAIVMGGTSWAKHALDYIAEKSGTTPYIYMGLSDENNYNWTGAGVTKYPLWVAQYNNYNTVYGFHPRSLYGRLRHWNKLAMFQYTSTGKIEGYYPLDFSVSYVSNDIKQDTQNSGGGAKVDNWVTLVTLNDIGAFKVTHATAVIWSSEKREKKVGMLKAGDLVKITKQDCGFYKIAGKDQWLDGRTGQFKPSPIYYDPNMTAKCEVVGKDAYGHAEAGGKVTGKHFPEGSTWRVWSRKGKWLKVGAGDNKYINGDKCRIVI